MVYWWLGGAAISFLTAASLLRAYVNNAILGFVIVVIALYTMGNLMMIPVMRSSGMAVAISVSGILQLVLTTIIAVGFFGEILTGWQIIGFILGIMAIMLIVFGGAATG